MGTFPKSEELKRVVVSHRGLVNPLNWLSISIYNPCTTRHAIMSFDLNYSKDLIQISLVDTRYTSLIELIIN